VPFDRLRAHKAAQGIKRLRAHQKRAQANQKWAQGAEEAGSGQIRSGLRAQNKRAQGT